MDHSPTTPDPTARLEETVALAAAETETVDHSGRTLAGYQLVRLIAQGGMGVVYEAVQLNLARRVAVKILTEELAARPEFVQRFQREAKAAAALNHPNMVQVHDFCQTEGFCLLVMEYVAGQDLSAYVEERGKLDIHQALDLIEQAATALKAASDKAIIHRDIKPSNLLLTEVGTVKVLDLGLAKILTESSDLTVTGIGMGSPYFIAPEQASDAAGVDHRVDIYSLGLTLLFLLTGKRPFEGNTPFSIVLAQATKPLPTGADLGTALPPAVEALIRKMAAKNPDERYASYDALLTDLRRIKAGHAPVFDLSAIRRKYLFPTIYATAAVILIALLSFGVILVRARKSGGTQHVKSPETVAAAENSQPVPVPEQPLRRPRGNHDLAGNAPPEGFDRPPDGPEAEPLQNGARARIPPPFGRLPRPAASPLQSGPPETMLAEADQYAAAHPQDFRSLVDCYRTVADRARGTPVEQTATSKMNQVIEQHQSALHRVLQEYEARMEEKLRLHKPEEAYALWRDFPENLRTLQSDQQIQQILERRLPPDFVPSHASP